MTDRSYFDSGADDDVMFCLTISKGTLKAGTQILRYMSLVQDDIKSMSLSLQHALQQLKEMFLEMCELAGVSPGSVPDVTEALAKLEEEEEKETESDSGEPIEFDPDIPDDDPDADDDDWGDDDDDSYGGRGIVYGGRDD
jgi:hypothetical protein